MLENRDINLDFEIWKTSQCCGENCCNKEVTLTDYFKSLNFNPPRKWDIWVGYVSEWKDGNMIITANNLTFYPVLNLDYEKYKTASIVRIEGHINDDNIIPTMCTILSHRNH